MSDPRPTAKRTRSSLRRLALFLFLVLLTAATAHSGTVTLTWDREDDPRIAGYNVYYGTSSGTYTDHVDAGNETRYTVTGLEEGTTYYFAVTAHDGAGSESPPSDEVQHTVGASSEGDGGSGSGNCFIATAAFGSPLAPEVQTLRAFRDTYLVTNIAGRMFVRAYYAISPSLANHLQQHERLKLFTRVFLVPFVYGAKHPQAIPAGLCGMLILAAALASRRVLRRGLTKETRG